MSEPRAGDRLVDPRGRVIGRVDAVFVDYLLVRTAGLLPVDLYVPRDQLTPSGNGRLTAGATADEAYRAWHRPLRKAPHD